MKKLFIPPQAPPLPETAKASLNDLERSERVTWCGWAVNVVTGGLHGLADWVAQAAGQKSHDTLFEEYETRQSNTVSLASAQWDRLAKTEKVLRVALRALSDLEEENEHLASFNRELERMLFDAEQELGRDVNVESLRKKLVAAEEALQKQPSSTSDQSETVLELKSMVASLREQMRLMSLEGQEEGVRIPDSLTCEQLAIRFVDDLLEKLDTCDKPKKVLEDLLVKLGVIDRQTVANVIVARPRPLALLGEEGAERAKNFVLRQLEEWIKYASELVIDPQKEEGFLDFNTEVNSCILDSYLRGRGKKGAQIAEYYGLPERGGLLDVTYKLMLGELVKRGKELLWNPMEAKSVDGWYQEEMAKAESIREPLAPPPPPPPVGNVVQHQASMTDVFKQIRDRRKEYTETT